MENELSKIYFVILSTLSLSLMMASLISVRVVYIFKILTSFTLVLTTATPAVVMLAMMIPIKIADMKCFIFVL